MHSPAVPAVLSRMRNEAVISTCLGCRVLGRPVACPGPLAATMTHGTGRSTNVLEAMWATVDTSNASHMRLREVYTHVYDIYSWKANVTPAARTQGPHIWETAQDIPLAIYTTECAQLMIDIAKCTNRIHA